MRHLLLLALLSAPAFAGDYFHKTSRRVAFERGDTKYVSAEGWQILDVPSMPPEALGEAQRTSALSATSWNVDPGTGVVTSTDQAALTAARSSARQSERADLLRAITRLKVERQQLRTLPPAWASAAVLDEAEASIDSEIAALSARGAER